MKLPKDRFFLFSALVAAFILIGGLLFTLFAPPAAYGAEGDFVPLVAIPNVNYATRSLGVYVNSAFNLIISLVAMLAVLRVITGGFKYMTTEAIGAKGDARETIQGAVFGLILLLGSWLILNTVNPQILDLSALQFESLQQEGDAKAFSDAQRAKREKAAQQARELFNPDTMDTYEDPETGETGRFKTVDVTDMEGPERSQYLSVCRNEIGGTAHQGNVTTCTKSNGESYVSTRLKWFSYTEFVCKNNETPSKETRISCVVPDS